MRRPRLRTAVFALTLVLGVPGAARAGMGDVVDYIIGLTGPAMFGIPLSCEIDLQTGDRACYAAGLRIPRSQVLDDVNQWPLRRLWLSAGGGVYFSTTKDSEMRSFDWFDVWILALEPTVHFRSFKTRDSNFVIEHGVFGMSYMFVFGDFKRFDNVGLKFTPIAFTKRNAIGRADLGLAYNLRFFPNAFTAEQFGAQAQPGRHEGREFVQGFTVRLGF